MRRLAVIGNVAFAVFAPATTSTAAATTAAAIAAVAIAPVAVIAVIGAFLAALAPGVRIAHRLFVALLAIVGLLVGSVRCV